MQFQLFVEGAHFLRGGIRREIRAAAGNERAVPAGGIHFGAGGIVGPEEAERHQEHVQQACVIGILDVFEHQFPVAGDALARNADDAQGFAVEHAIEQREHFRAQIIFQRLHIGGGACEDCAVAARHAQFCQAVIALVEIIGHSAMAADTLDEGHAREIAIQPIRPLVIGALKGARRSIFLAADFEAAMSALVFQDVDIAFLIAHNDDGGFAQMGSLEISGVGDLGFEAHEIP